MKQNQNEYIFLETTLNPRLSTPRAAYLFQTHWGGGGDLIETEGLIIEEGRRWFNLAKTMVSVQTWLTKTV